MWKTIVAVCVGASSGAVLRWWLGVRLNAVFPTIPLGTLAANLIGAYVIGAAVAFFASFSALAPEWRLFVMTGFCGGLTTFSTFTLELATLVRERSAPWIFTDILVHLGGSLLLVFAGMGSVAWLRSLYEVAR